MTRAVLLFVALSTVLVAACSSDDGPSIGIGPCAQVTAAQWAVLYPTGGVGTPQSFGDRCEVPVTAAGSDNSTKLTIGRLIENYDERVQYHLKRGDQTHPVVGIGDQAFWIRDIKGNYVELVFKKHGHQYLVDVWFGADRPSSSDADVESTITQIASSWAATL